MPTSATLAGIATIKGFLGGAADVTFDNIAATLTPLTGDHTDNFDSEEQKDGDGNIVCVGATNPTQEFQLECFVTGEDVETAQGLTKPTPLQVITIAGLPVTATNGDYNYTGGFNVKTGENFAKVSLRVKRYAGAALAVLS